MLIGPIFAYSNPEGLLTPPIPQATITELIRIDREVEPLIEWLRYLPKYRLSVPSLSYPITPHSLTN